MGRVWEFGGLWDERSWRRPPKIEKMQLGILEQGEKLWLYQVEDAVLMLEVKPEANSVSSTQAIGQVVLKRLMSADDALARLNQASGLLQPSNGDIKE